MAKTFQIEFWLNGDAIDAKDFDTIPDVPAVGDKIFLNCDNPNMNDGNGHDFKIVDKVSLFFIGQTPKQKILLKLEKIDKPKW
jgi:hypothetical protein